MRHEPEVFYRTQLSQSAKPIFVRDKASRMPERMFRFGTRKGKAQGVLFILTVAIHRSLDESIDAIVAIICPLITLSVIVHAWQDKILFLGRPVICGWASVSQKPATESAKGRTSTVIQELLYWMYLGTTRPKGGAEHSCQNQVSGNRPSDLLSQYIPRRRETLLV